MNGCFRSLGSHSARPRQETALAEQPTDVVGMNQQLDLSGH